VQKIRSVKECAQLVFLCEVMADWVKESKRFLPEVIAFLSGSLMMSVPTTDSEDFPTMNFPVSIPHRNMLIPNEKIHLGKPMEQLSLSVIFKDEPLNPMDPQQGILIAQTVRNLLSVLSKFVRLYEVQSASYCAVFSGIRTMLERIPAEKYPSEIIAELEKVKEELDERLDNNRPVRQMKLEKRKEIKILPMLEPKFDEHFDPSRPHTKTLREDREAGKATQRVHRQLKKETRGAIKKLRMDARFLGRMQGDRQSKISRERRDKTKAIMQGLQMQESEYKKREGMKNKKKF